MNSLRTALTLMALISLASCDDKRTEQSAKNTTNRKDTATKKKPIDEPAPQAPAITYHVLTKKDSLRKAITKIYTQEQRNLIYALNRLDGANSKRPDTLIVPDTLLPDRMAYAPFPAQAPFLKDVSKIVFFSYPIQAFAAYEHGNLIYWGPTSMGKKATPTPTGLFFANWKAKETISTVDDEWKLKWNFNIHNQGGVGWHQYAMPGYPASHSCLRMLEYDARFMYGWAEQWILEGNDKVLASGTPTIVYGAYPFGQPRPWFALLTDPRANTVTVEDLQKEAEPFLEKILQKQEERALVTANRRTDSTAKPVDRPADTAATAKR